MANRSQEQIAVSISLSRNLLAEIDARAKAMGMSRSHYIAVVTRLDINDGSTLPAPVNSETRAGFIRETMDFLILALKQYERGSRNDIPEPTLELERDDIWELFMAELEQIAKHKWMASKEAGYDIGPERAIRDWVQKHQPGWIAVWDRESKTAPATGS